MVIEGVERAGRPGLRTGSVNELLVTGSLQVTLHLPLPLPLGLSLLIWKREVLPRISDAQRIQRTPGMAVMPPSAKPSPSSA